MSSKKNKENKEVFWKKRDMLQSKIKKILILTQYRIWMKPTNPSMTKIEEEAYSYYLGKTIDKEKICDNKQMFFHIIVDVQIHEIMKEIEKHIT